MENIYKLILYNQNIYKEIELLSDVDQLSIGTYYDNNIRIKKNYFWRIFISPYRDWMIIRGK
jgi:hypothetical protein